VSEVDTHLVSLSLSLVGVISGGLLLHGGLGDTIILELLVVLVDILELLLVVLHHHAHLEHTLGEVLDGDVSHVVTVEELELENLVGNGLVKLVIILVNS